MNAPCRARSRVGRAAAVSLVLALAASAAQAQESSKLQEGARKYFTDVVLIDQHGQEQRLYSDLISGRVVLIHSMFSTCSGVCPVMAAKLQKVQDFLGERLGKDTVILSVTVDPETDTPAKLAEYAERFGARPGWYFLTGAPENVEFALRRLGHYVEDKEAHSPVMIMGNEPTGLWKKAMGLADASKIVAIFESVLEDDGRGPA